MKFPSYLLAALALTYCYSCSSGSNHGHEHSEIHDAHDTHDHHDGHDDHDDHDHHDSHDNHDNHDYHDAHDNHDSHDHDGHDGEIRLAHDRAEALGVKVDTLRLEPISEVISVTGEVIPDPATQGMVVAPISGRVTLGGSVKEGASVSRGQSIASVSGAGLSGGDANRAARIALDAAKREVDRLTPLRDEGIVTAAEYASAVRAYEEAKNAMGSGSGAATSPISGVITKVEVANGQYVEAGQPIATVAAKGALTIRADVPKRYAAGAASVKKATVRLPYTGESIDATIASKPSDAAATQAYRPMYFTATGAADLSQGSYVEVFLITGEGRQGIKVPVQSVTERLGQKFVYVKEDADCYERRPVTIGSSDGRSIEILSGLAPGDVVVTEGTTYVRLAETSNVAPQGHTHNH